MERYQDRYNLKSILFGPAQMLGAILVIGLICNSGLAGEVVIDDFSAPADGTQYQSPGSGFNEWTNTTNGTGTLGSYRDGAVGCESQGGQGDTKATLTAAEEFEMTSNNQGNSSVYLSYDDTSGWGTDDQPEGDKFNGAFSNTSNGSLGAPVDLTDGGSNDRFELTFTFADLDDGTLNNAYFNDFLITLAENDGGTLGDESDDIEYQYNAGAGGDDSANTWMATNYSDLNAGTARTFTVDFQEFGSASLDDVEAVQLHICTEETDFDYTLTSFKATPEPGLAALAVLALAGVLGCSRPRFARG